MHHADRRGYDRSVGWLTSVYRAVAGHVWLVRNTRSALHEVRRDAELGCRDHDPQRSPGLDGVDRDFYIRQLWDWKASIDLSTMDESGLHAYTRACGWSMARAHARSGDRVAVAAYLGAGPKFDQAIAQFCTAYADQNELDYQRLADAVSAGEVSAESGI